MTFKMKYNIVPQYLTTGSLRRPGIPLRKLSFFVAHDTGNPGSTASGNVGYYERSRNEMEASAQDFVDDVAIMECIPLFTGVPEKAWHVRYDPVIDNQLFGGDANDYAGGVELCYGGGLNLYEAYDRYKWLLAYGCYKFEVDPATRITGHHILDPSRKVDPMSAFKILGITFDEFIDDVVAMYESCTTVIINPVGGHLSQDVVDTIIATWISKSWFQSGSVAQKDYIHWLADMLRDSVQTSFLNPGVAETVLQTWLKPSWAAATDQGQKDYIRWLGLQLRVAGNLPLE